MIITTTVIRLYFIGTFKNKSDPIKYKAERNSHKNTAAPDTNRSLRTHRKTVGARTRERQSDSRFQHDGFVGKEGKCG